MIEHDFFILHSSTKKSVLPLLSSPEPRACYLPISDPLYNFGTWLWFTMKVPSCKKIKEKLKKCSNMTIIPRRWRDDKQASLGRSDLGNVSQSSPDDSTPPRPGTIKKDKISFGWMSISSLFSSSSKERARDSSQSPSSFWFTPTRLSASPEEAQEPRDSSQRQSSPRAPSTISIPLSETHSLTRINAEDQSSPGEESVSQPRSVLEDHNSHGHLDFGALDGFPDQGLFSWNDRHPTLNDAWSDRTDVQVGEVIELEGLRSTLKAILRQHDLSRNPFRPRPKHLKQARVRFTLG